MSLRPHMYGMLGGAAAVALGFVAAQVTGRDLAARLDSNAKQAISEIDGRAVTVRFSTESGLASRHPVLKARRDMPEEMRERVAKAVGEIPGIGGVRWADGTMMALPGLANLSPLHCQNDVEALLKARTIRFEGGSSNIDRLSGDLLDEVATALRPCIGSTIAITGHTDAVGTEEENVALSRQRAQAVLRALIARRIPAADLRASGVGSSEPIAGLSPEDPANRRIEFSLIAKMRLKPTPVDTPGPR